MRDRDKICKLNSPLLILPGEKEGVEFNRPFEEVFDGVSEVISSFIDWAIKSGILPAIGGSGNRFCSRLSSSCRTNIAFE